MVDVPPYDFDTMLEDRGLKVDDDAPAADGILWSSSRSALAISDALTEDRRLRQYKDPVTYTATNNLSLNGLAELVDGRTLDPAGGERILAVAQNDETKNGIWVTAGGAWTRAPDADTAQKIANMVTWARKGDSNYGREYKLAVGDAIVLETTKLTFVASAYGDSEAVRRPRGTAVIVWDSNGNGRTAFYTALPLELSGVNCPMGLWTWYNMAQNGSQLQGWRAATEASSLTTAAAPADYTGITNPNTDLYQVCKAAPDLIWFGLGINDLNSVANRATAGQALGENVDWAINFLLENNPNKDGVIVLNIAAPFGSIDFVVGSITTGWGDDAATYGNANAAENAAYWSRVLAGHYLRWKGRNPRVIVHDTREIFNPGSTANPLLHRCDDPKVNCLDPVSARARFRGTIDGANVLTVDAMYGGGTLAVGYVVTDDVYGIGSGRTIVSLGTGTGGVGTYNLSAGPAVSQRVMKIPRPLIDDSLHFSGIGGRRIVESWAMQAGIEYRRNVRSYAGSAMGTDPYYTIFQTAAWSRSIWYQGRQASGGTDYLVSVVPSPEALLLKGDPESRVNDGRATSMQSLPFAEFALTFDDLSRALQVANLRGSRIKMTVKGGTGTIYTASSVNRSSTGTTITFYHVLLFKDVNLAAEPSAGEMIVWVDDPGQIPYLNKPIGVALPPGTAAVASTALQNPVPPSTNGLLTGLQLRNIEATRFASTDGACDITVGLSNQSADNRLVEVVTTKTASIAGTTLTTPDATGVAIGQTVTGAGVTAGTVITAGSGTSWTVNNSQTVGPVSMTFGIVTQSAAYPIGTLSFTSTSLVATWTPNQANIDAAVNAGIGWLASGGPSNVNHARWKALYRLSLVPSITLTKPVTVTVSD